ncbi:MAG: TM1802 family CRISPR-associated protein [Syntrophomonas sp.]
MGFLNAMQAIGATDQKSGLETYLSFPLRGQGKVIRVWLKTEGDSSISPLNILGIYRVDIAEFSDELTMLRRYMYRKPPSSATWTFSPIRKIDKPASEKSNYVKFFGKEGIWKEDKKSLLYKFNNAVLPDYEREKVFAEGSTALIMSELETKIQSVFKDLDKNFSHIIVFGFEDNGDFRYPGDIQPMVEYFKRKLSKSLKGTVKQNREVSTKPDESRKCKLCENETYTLVTLDKVFKFSTNDKMNTLPGLDKKEIKYAFSVCESCFQEISSGREKVDRIFTERSLLPGINIWAIPEATSNNQLLRNLLTNWQEAIGAEKAISLSEKREKQYFSRMAAQGSGLVFHFVFWETNKNQERVHLMIEDVPPERLARLASCWIDAFSRVSGNNVESNGVELDWAIRSLYKTLNTLVPSDKTANKNKKNNDKKNKNERFFRDFALTVIGKMLQGSELPVDAFKKLVMARLSSLIHGDEKWEDIQKTMLYIQVWVEYMILINYEMKGVK